LNRSRELGGLRGDGRKINPDVWRKAKDARRRSKVAESERLEIEATTLMA